MPRPSTSPGKTDPAHTWLALDVVDDAGDWSGVADVEALIHEAARALARHPRFAGERPAEACIALSNDAAVRRLNATYRAKDKATNVLSFPAAAPGAENKSGTRTLGDIVIASETVFAEAREQGIPPAHHLQHLAVHGLLHLLGLDHETDEDANVMESLEIEILQRLSIPNPYSDPIAPAATIGDRARQH